MKTVLVVLLDKYADWEAAYVMAGLRQLDQGQCQVKTVALTSEPIHSFGGLTVQPDFGLEDMPDYDGMVLIGGYTWREEQTRALEPYISECAKSGRLLAAICDATVFIGSMGLLNGVKHTSNDLQDLKAYAGAEYSGENGYVNRQCVRDKNIITANGSATVEFATAVLSYLDATDQAELGGQAWHPLANLPRASAYGRPCQTLIRTFAPSVRVGPSAASQGVTCRPLTCGFA